MRGPFKVNIQHYLFIDKVEVELLHASGTISTETFATIKANVELHTRPSGEPIVWSQMPGRYETCTMVGLKSLESPWSI